MKYQFEVKEKINDCGDCPCLTYDNMEDSMCGIDSGRISFRVVPDHCKLVPVKELTSSEETTAGIIMQTGGKRNE